MTRGGYDVDRLQWLAERAEKSVVVAVSQFSHRRDSDTSTQRACQICHPRPMHASPHLRSRRHPDKIDRPLFQLCLLVSSFTSCILLHSTLNHEPTLHIYDTRQHRATLHNVEPACPRRRGQAGRRGRCGRALSSRRDWVSSCSSDGTCARRGYWRGSGRRCPPTVAVRPRGGGVPRWKG